MPLLRILVGALFFGFLTMGVAANAKSSLFAPWIDGTKEEPIIQVQAYDRDTYVIRQSIRTNFEGPFLYLFFGKDRALLLDTGAGGLEIRPAIDGLIAKWGAEHGKSSIPLVVAHTHAHGDHHQGDAEFKNRENTVVVGLSASEVAAFFKIKNWPVEVGSFDLGERILHIIPTPGHDPAHIMIFDEKTRLLQTGDAFYPGRLYFDVDQFAAFRESIDRVVAFAKPRNVAYILANHIEMSRTLGQDYPMRAPSHPDERELELSFSTLLELQGALHAMKDKPTREVHDSFIIYPR